MAISPNQIISSEIRQSRAERSSALNSQFNSNPFDNIPIRIDTNANPMYYTNTATPYRNDPGFDPAYMESPEVYDRYRRYGDNLGFTNDSERQHFLNYIRQSYFQGRYPSERNQGPSKSEMMNELKKYLTDNLEVKLEMSESGDRIEAKTSILLAGEEISSDSDYVTYRNIDE